MSGKQLAKRIVSVLLMTVGILLVLAVMRAEGTPIRPDIKQVLSQPAQQNDFAPARAGWDGPEMKTGRVLNTTYEQLSPSATARQVRQSLLAAAIPDYRAVAGITLVILLLRRIRNTRRKALAAATQGASVHVMNPPPSIDDDARHDRAA